MRVSVDNLGQYGIIKDIPDYELPYNAWNAGQNIRIDDLGVEKSNGYSAVFGTPTVAPYYVTPVSVAATYYWVYASLAAVYVYNGSTHTDITRSAGAYSADADTGWNGGVISGIPILNNGVDDPQMWSPVNTSTPLASLTWSSGTTWSSQGYTAKVIRPFREFLVALDFDNGVTRNERMVRWSTAALPGAVPSTWDDSDATEFAGAIELSETQGFCIDCLPLRDVNIIYKEDSVYRMQYIGGNNIFRFDKVFLDIGILSRDCVAEFDGKHIVLISGPDVIVHDGNTSSSIVNAKWRNWLADSIDPTNYQKSFIAPNYQSGEMWICFPTTDSTYANKALVWNWREDTFGERDLPNVRFIASGIVDPNLDDSWNNDTDTWDSDTTSWNQRSYNPSAKSLLMAGTSDTKLYQADTTTQANGTNFTSYVERTGLSISGQKRNGETTSSLYTMKTVSAIYPKIEATAGTTVYISVGYQMEIGDAVDWGTPQAFVVGTDYKVDVRVTGRLIGVRYRTTDDSAWRVTSYEIDVDVAPDR